MATANGSRDGDSKRHDPRRDVSLGVCYSVCGIIEGSADWQTGLYRSILFLASSRLHATPAPASDLQCPATGLGTRIGAAPWFQRSL